MNLDVFNNPLKLLAMALKNYLNTMAVPWRTCFPYNNLEMCHSVFSLTQRHKESSAVCVSSQSVCATTRIQCTLIVSYYKIIFSILYEEHVRVGAFTRIGRSVSKPPEVLRYSVGYMRDSERSVCSSRLQASVYALLQRRRTHTHRIRSRSPWYFNSCSPSTRVT